MAHSAHIIVIGAGHNGLTTAAWLARAGCRVTVLEARGAAGGLAAAEEFAPGYRTSGLLHDTAGLDPEVVTELRLQQRGLQLATPGPVLLAEPDGPGLLLHADHTMTVDEISRRSEDDARRYPEFCAFIDQARSVLVPALRSAPPDLVDPAPADLWTLARQGLAARRLGRRQMMELLRVGPMCVADWLNEWFKNPLLVAGLAGPAVYGTYMGPWSPGSALNGLIDLVRSGQEARGGPQSLIAALLDAVRAAGAEVRTEARVTALRLHRGRVTGVALAGGETIDAAVVAASCHPKQTFLQLIDPALLPAALEHRAACLRSRGTTAKVTLALNGPLVFAGRGSMIARARIAGHVDEIERAFDAVKYRDFARQPVLDVRVVTDGAPELAPDGHNVVSILAHFAPGDVDGGWTDARREALGDAVVEVLQRCATGLKQRIVAREVLTPTDIEQRYSLPGGCIHHIEHAPDQLLVRPLPQCAQYATPIPGLYLCGSGSHPGGGITCTPARLAAERILRDLRTRGRIATQEAGRPDPVERGA